jgi:hypothetical protein
MVLYLELNNMSNDMNNKYGTITKPMPPEGWEITAWNQDGDNAGDDPSGLDGIIFAIKSKEGKQIYLQQHLNDNKTQGWFAAYYISCNSKPLPLKNIIACADYGIEFCCAEAAKYSGPQRQ